MLTITVKFPADLADWVSRQARSLNRPKSEVIRNAVEAQRKGENFDSVLYRAGDLVGKYASGRKDSSHKKHLKSLGSWKRS